MTLTRDTPRCRHDPGCRKIDFYLGLAFLYTVCPTTIKFEANQTKITWMTEIIMLQTIFFAIYCFSVFLFFF